MIKQRTGNINAPEINHDFLHVHSVHCVNKNRFDLMIICYILTGTETRPQFDYYYTNCKLVLDVVN